MGIFECRTDTAAVIKLITRANTPSPGIARRHGHGGIVLVAVKTAVKGDAGIKRPGFGSAELRTQRQMPGITQAIVARRRTSINPNVAVAVCTPVLPAQVTHDRPARVQIVIQAGHHLLWRVDGGCNRQGVGGRII